MTAQRSGRRCWHKEQGEFVMVGLVRWMGAAEVRISNGLHESKEGCQSQTAW